MIRISRIFRSSALNRPGAQSLLFDAPDISSDLDTARSQHLAASHHYSAGSASGGLPHLQHHHHQQNPHHHQQQYYHQNDAQQQNAASGSTRGGGGGGAIFATPVAAYTGAAFPPHTTALLAEAARREGFTSPYWLTSRAVRTKQIPLKPGAIPCQVCMEGDGMPRIYQIRFIDDLHPDDVELFLRDAPPIPENAAQTGTEASFVPKMQQQQHHGGSGGNRNYHQRRNNNKSPTGVHHQYNPIVYFLRAERWRIPGNAATVQRLCSTVAARRRSVTMHGTDNKKLFLPVFLDDSYVCPKFPEQQQRGGFGGIRVLNDQIFSCEDSTITLFYNANQTLLPPHAVVPLVPPPPLNQQHHVAAYHSDNSSGDHSPDGAY